MIDITNYSLLEDPYRPSTSKLVLVQALQET